MAELVDRVIISQILVEKIRVAVGAVTSTALTLVRESEYGTARNLSPIGSYNDILQLRWLKGIEA